ncbi:MAG: flavoprotein [Candidatus Omnitrophota bacterium]
MKKQKRVLVGVTGSIACYKALEIIRGLRKKNISIEVVLTKEAEEFIKPVLFQALSGNRVLTHDLFVMPEEWAIDHVALAERIDLLAIVPATANIIAKAAAGICDDMLSCAICTTKTPILFAPAMNSNMYDHKVTQDNIKRLKALGYYFTGPIKGKLACGDEGIGHIQEVDKIIEEVIRLLR